MSLEAILQALGAKDEADGLRIVLESNKFASDVMVAAGVRTLDEALSGVKANAKLVTSIETATGKKGEEAQGVVLGWKTSHEALPVAQADLAKATASLATYAVDTMINKAKAEHKLTPAEETTLRQQITDGDVSVKGATALLATKAPHPALVNAKTLVQPLVEGSGPAGAVFADLVGKTYEDLTVDQRAELRQRDGGEAAYQALRSDWESRGKPKKKAA